MLIEGSEQKINIELGKIINKETNVNDNNYSLQITNLKKEINEIKKDKNLLLKKIKNLEDIILEQKREVEELKNWKNKYNLVIEQIQMTKKNNIILNKIDSKIITKIEELEFLEKRLKNNEILMKKNIIYKLLYRATRDGNDTQIFHKKCDNIMGTLSIIKTTKGMRFGGYTEKKWCNTIDNITFYKDYKGICFCFSLDLFRIYDFNGNSSRSIGCYYGYGPYFLDDKMNFFYLYNSSNLWFGSTSYTTKGTSFGKFVEDYEINNGLKEFSVIELEVFQILFDN